MAGFCRRQSYKGRTDPAVLVERLKNNLLTGAEGTVAGKSHSALVFAELLGLLNGQLDDYDDALELALARHPDAHIFRSFPGVGLITASTLLAEIGEDRSYYPQVGMLMAEAGLAPVTRASGRSHHVGFRYAANSRLREACTWWAYNSLKSSPWAREAYDQARARKLPHHRALRGLGARWMRVLWRAWTDGVPYDAARHMKLHPAGEQETPAAKLIGRSPARPMDARASAMPLNRTAFGVSDTRKLTVGVCRVHFMRNVLAKVSKSHDQMVAATIRTIFAQPGQQQVRAHVDLVADMLHGRFPAVAQMLLDAKADLTAFADFPHAHWRKIWSTNPLERLNREVKRRTDVVGIFPNPASLLRLSSCVLIEAHDEWQDSDRRYLSEESMALLNPPAPTVLATKTTSPSTTGRKEIAATA